MVEVIVVGGGPAGATAALRARELGATGALVERGNLGGTCANDGCVGLTGDKAREEHDAVVAVVPYADLDRGIIDGHPESFCKLVVDRPSRRVLGAHIVGEQAVEVVQIAGVAMRVEELADVESAYPTFTAIVGLAARRALRDLGLVATSSRWGTPELTDAVEWEHSGGKT